MCCSPMRWRAACCSPARTSPPRAAASGRGTRRTTASSRRLCELRRCTSIGRGNEPWRIPAVPSCRSCAAFAARLSVSRAAGNPGHEYGAALIVFSDPDVARRCPRARRRTDVRTLARRRRALSCRAGRRRDDGGLRRRGRHHDEHREDPLRQIFLKTGVNRQADFIRAVAANPLVKLGRDCAAE